MVGTFGQTMIMVCLIAGLGLITPFFFLQASHIYVTTLTMSSGGEDRFRWPRKSYYEWFGEGMLVFGILFIWSILSLIPVALLFLFISPQWGLVTWMVVMWLMAPISMVSVMSAPSRLLFLYPPLIGRLIRQAKGVVFVYFITAILFSLVLVGFWLMFVRRNPVGIFVAAFHLPPALMLHGRAWGRLAWLALNYDRPPPTKKKKRKSKSTRSEKALDVALELVDDDQADYSVKPAKAAASERLTTVTEHYAQQQDYERELRHRGGDPNPDPLEGPKVPTFGIALGHQLFSFLFDGESLGVWLGFGLACLVELAILFFLAPMVM